jgi:cytochrome c
MKITIAAIVAAATLAAGAVHAQDVLKAKGCLNCHEMDKKKVGPAYKDVAAKYKGNKDAEAMLVAKLKEGKGHMKISATDDELKAAIKQVLSTK